MLRSSLIALQGTIIAQMIGFLFMPVLARLFTPAAFGSYQLYMAIVTTLCILTSLRYEFALLNADPGEEERAVLHLCLILNVLTGLCGVPGLRLVDAWLPGRVAVSGGLPWVLAAGVSIGGILQTLGYVLLREQVLRINANSKIIQVTAFCLAAVIAAFLGAEHLGLAGADVIGRIAGLAPIGLWIAGSRHALFEALPSSSAMRAAAVKFRKYPFYSLPGGLLSATINLVVPVFMLSAFGSSVMGQYALVERTLMMPSALIGQSVAQAFTAQFSAVRVAGGKDALKMFTRVLLVMSALGLVPALILWLYGPALFGLVFGEQWAFASSVTPAFAILVLSNLAISPLNMTLVVSGHQKHQLGWEASRLALVILTWTAVVSFSIPPRGAIALHVGVLTSLNVAFLWLAYRAVLKVQEQSVPNA